MKRIIGLLLFFACAEASAANYTINCGSCGNTSHGSISNTLNTLRYFNGAFEAGNGWKIGQTVQVFGGDGSRGVYKKYTNHSAIQYGCVSSCGSEDDYAGLLPPISPPSSGGGGGGGGSHGGIGGGGGPIGGGGGCGTVVVDGVPHTDCYSW